MGEVIMSGVVANAVAPKPTVPTGYTKLAYIRSSGTQYIDTGFKPNQNTRMVVTMELDSSMTSSRAYFGTRDASKVNGFAILTGTDNKYQFAYNNLQETGIGSVTFAKNVFEIDKNAFKVNGNVLSTQTAGTFSCSCPAFLLTVNNAGAVHSLGGVAAKLYSCQVYDNGTLVREYVPCMDPEGNVGLYDRVGESFYKNAGTGVFVGSEV